MKIVILPGVGFREKDNSYDFFINNLQKKIKHEINYHNWIHHCGFKDHDNNHISSNKMLKSKRVRGLVSEVILDFQSVLIKSEKIEIPDADVYITHSAGSILALNEIPEKHLILMGSPAGLISEEFNVNEKTMINIIHKNDPIAYPLDGIENFYFDSHVAELSRYCPIGAHSKYWKSNKVINKIAEKFNQWF